MVKFTLQVPVEPYKTYLNVGKINSSYSFAVASWTIANAGCNTAASTSAAFISCCKNGHTCCHHNFYHVSKGEKEGMRVNVCTPDIKNNICINWHYYHVYIYLLLE